MITAVHKLWSFPLVFFIGLCCSHRYWGKLIIASILFVLMEPLYANQLGRLFTSPDERQQLEKLRNKQTKPKILTEHEAVELEEVTESLAEEPVDAVEYTAIKLNGIVHRNGGKSTAWINNANTYDGNHELYDIHISVEDIDTESVTMDLPDKKNRVKIKVCESYDPDTAE